MISDPNDLPRYTASERANHWLVGICFILLALSGLALFQPYFWPLTALFGGGTWTRILHPFVGVVMALSFGAMFVRSRTLNAMTPADWDWLKRARQMVADGNDHNMPEQGKYNGGQKLMFWALAISLALLLLSGIALWRSYFGFSPGAVRFAAVIHALSAAVMIALVMFHIYAAIWVRGSLRAMWYGTVTRAWARQHHRAWYRQMTGK